MALLPEPFDPRTVADLSPFSEAAPDFIDAGYHVVPVMPGSKAPGQWRDGRWTPMDGWNDFSAIAPDEVTVARWKTWPNAGIGVVLGTPIGDDLQLIALDFDTDDEDELAALAGAVPDSPMCKRGQRGYTAFYRAPRSLETAPLRVPAPLPGQPTRSRMLLEILTGNKPRQTVMPPSVHPDTGRDYEWGTRAGEGAADIVPIDQLPLLTSEHIEAIKDVAAAIGWQRPAPRVAAEQDNEEGETVWRRTNNVALQRFDRWVPHLRLPKLRRLPNGSWEGVPFWRPSNNGTDLDKRKPNLKFHVSGIKDMGADAGYTPLDVVAAVFMWDFDECFTWLRQKIGLADEEEMTILDPPRLVTADEHGTLHDAETGEILVSHGRAQHPIAFPIFCAADLAGLPAPPREFLVPDFVPANTVTLLYGDGGAGKSLVSLMLATATATGASWLGVEIEQGTAVFLTAEDDRDELNRRLCAIMGGSDELAALTDLHVVPLVGEDAVLATPDRSSEMMRPTGLFAKVAETVARLKPRLLVLDTLADLFGGDEIKKAQVRSFISMLNGLAFRERVTILLLAHPSQSGLTTGTGTSGNVAWSNSVRSRLYMTAPSSENRDLRRLESMKTNYSRSGVTLLMTWAEGRFEPVDEAEVRTEDLSAAKAEFLRLLGEFTDQGRPVSHSPSSTFAPKLFFELPDARFSKKKFADAMNRLFSEGVITTVIEGPPSRQRSRIVLAREVRPTDDANSDEALEGSEEG